MQSNTRRGRLIGLIATLALLGPAAADAAEARERLRIPVGRAEVVTYSEDVRTVAIAEPKIADAAVGSARTVVVNGKSPGITTLVIYGQGARFTTYDVEILVPNGEKQVQLAVRLGEMNESARRELGLDFVGAVESAHPLLDGVLRGGLYTTKVSSPSDPLTIGPATDGYLSYRRARGDLSLQTIWRALEENGDIRTLANPTLVAHSGEKASFLAGGEFPVPVASTGAGGAITVTIEWKEFGVQVEFTPTVEEDSSITLKVTTEVSQLDFTNELSLSGFTVPSVVTRRASTVVNLDGGEHLVIGGLKQTERLKTVRRVPVIGRVPVLGAFFSHSIIDQVERELLVVVSPEMLTAAATALPAMPSDRPVRDR